MTFSPIFFLISARKTCLHIKGIKNVTAQDFTVLAVPQCISTDNGVSNTVCVLISTVISIVWITLCFNHCNMQAG